MIVFDFVASAGLKPKVAVHVGANRALEAEHYEALGIGRMIWIEADDRLAKMARLNLAARPPSGTRHTLVQALITDRDGVETQFHILSNKGASSSIYRPTHRHLEAFPHVHETAR